MTAVPGNVVQTITACYGEEGLEWLAKVPSILERITAQWHLRLGAPFAGGCVAYVAPAERADGSKAVLKISFIDDETRYEGDALMLWAGRGAALLLEQDRDAGALLLERVEPGTALRDHADRDVAISIACQVLRRLSIVLGPAHPFDRVTNLAADWAHGLGARFQAAGKPFPEHYVRRATELCEDLSVSPEEPVLVNRDFHLANVLAGTREAWLAIDPKPLAGEPAFSTAHLLRSSLSPDFAASDADRLLTLIGAELVIPTRSIAVWVFVRSVENALWSVETRLEDSRFDLHCADCMAGWM